MRRQNLENIETIFEVRTGVDLHPSKKLSRRKWAFLVAAVLCCLAMSSCAYMLFSPLKGDTLALRGSYSNGVVFVQVVNGSERPLRFQEKVKLMSWQKGEIPSTGETVRFENTVFAPHSSGTMTIDLSQAYPMAELEAQSIPNDLYLVLTNHDFAFGQDWICSFLLESREETEAPAPPVPEIAAQNADGIDPSLRFYFEDSYLDQPPAHNAANGEYMAAVQALLSRQKGVQVHSVDPHLFPEEPEMGVIFAPAVPVENQRQLTLLNYHSLDSFNRMVGPVFPGDGLDSALMLGVSLPQYQGQEDGGIGDFKLLYYFTFPTQELQQAGAYAFVSGRILSFPEMEHWKVYEDTQYTVYDLTDLFYTDLDQYLDDFVSAYGGSVYVDEQVRQRVHRIYDYYHNRENLRFQYLLP